MQWLQSVFQGESTGLTLTAIVLGLTVALILLFWIFRKIAGPGKQTSRRARQPRLAITDIARVDDKRRLVLLRRDDVEHLVMIGGGSDVLVEHNISREREIAEKHNISVDYPKATASEAAPANVAVPAVVATTAATDSEPVHAERGEPAEVRPPEPAVEARQPKSVENELLVRHAEASATNPRTSEPEPPTKSEPKMEKTADSVVEKTEEPEAPIGADEFERQEFPANAAARAKEISREKETQRPPAKSGSEVEDEMQRLLDELSSR